MSVVYSTQKLFSDGPFRAFVANVVFVNISFHFVGQFKYIVILYLCVCVLLFCVFVWLCDCGFVDLYMCVLVYSCICLFCGFVFFVDLCICVFVFVCLCISVVAAHLFHPPPCRCPSQMWLLPISFFNDLHFCNQVWISFNKF